MKIELIAHDDVERVWPILEPFIIAACNYPTAEATPNTLKTNCMSGECGLLRLNDGSGAAAVWVEDDVLHIGYLGGVLPPNWVSNLTMWLKVAAIHFHAKKIVGGGRKGWQRKLIPYGWQGDGKDKVWCSV